MVTGEEFRFKIDAYTPETLPMSRLAEYLEALAVLLGEKQAVHFVRIENGSAVPVIRVEAEATPKVRERIKGVRRGSGVSDAMRAYRSINEKLRLDNTTGLLSGSTAADILTFPGKEEVLPDFGPIRQRGSVDGEVIRVGGQGERVPIMLQAEEGVVTHLFTTKPLAKALGRHLYESVRLFGKGRWCRDREGKWNLEHFSIESFEVLNSEPLSAALAGLRVVQGGWQSGSLRELRDLRGHGDSD